ncbi:hypothetical protein [Tenacibaculum discolor]|nr:hypothetical protein [Tenacibaculum discolor]
MKLSGEKGNIISWESYNDKFNNDKDIEKKKNKLKQKEKKKKNKIK